MDKILISNQLKIRKDILFPENRLNIRAPAHQSQTGCQTFCHHVLMPDTAVRTTVGQLGTIPDTWTWDLVLRIKHRFGISTETIVYRLKELNLITNKSSNIYIQKIETHYKQISFGEPGASRRILNTDGQFFVFLLTANSNEIAGQEIKHINTMAEELKLVKIQSIKRVDYGRELISSC